MQRPKLVPATIPPDQHLSINDPQTLPLHGDVHAQRRQAYKRVNLFLEQNKDLRHEVAPNMIAEFRVNSDGLMRMTVEIPENFTGEDLKRAMPLIRDWRQRLTAFQGWSTARNPAQLYERLAQLKYEGHSYNQIADLLNQEFLDYMKVEGDEAHTALARRAAMDLLAMMGVRRIASIKWWMQVADTIVSDGGKKFSMKEERPITRDHVIARLKAWKHI